MNCGVLIMFKPITKVLKKGASAVWYDQKAFNDYSRGEISIEECMDKFFNNNQVKKEERAEITQDLFKKWLYTEGYGCNGL